MKLSRSDFLVPRVFILLLILFIVIFSCLAYGGVGFFHLAIIEGVVVFIVLFWLGGMVYKGSLSFIKTGLFFPVAIFFAIMVLQLIPLPRGLIELISPHTASLYRKIIPQQAAEGFLTLSLSPNLTIAELLRFLIYFGAFFLVINNIETKREFDFLIQAIIFFGFLLSIFGIIQKYAYSHKVYWFDAYGSAPTPFGPFVNRNNFSGYINMIIPLALSYSLMDMPLGKRVIYGFYAGFMSLALFFSLARAGILVYIIALFFMLALLSLRGSLKAKAKYLSIWFLLALLLFIVFIDKKVILTRFVDLFKKETFIAFGHGYLWRDIFRMWQDFPLFGIGLGTFRSISGMYKSIPTQELITYAHCDFLQLLAESGILGFLSLAIFFILYFKSVINEWFKRHDPYVVYLTLAGLTSIFTVLVYSLLDFNLHIPANALLFFLMMGLTYRLAFTRFKNARTTAG